MDFVERGERVVLVSEPDADGLQEVRLNRPHAKNAVHDWAYTLLAEALKKAAEDARVAAVVLTGTGDFFCGGADLKAGFDPFVGPLKSGKGSLCDPVGKFMTEVIRFPKLLVAAINGPAVGVGATLVPHCDVVFAVEKAQFWTPFTQLAVTPEFCSSMTFPAIMGTSLASEVLYLGRRLSAKEALQCGFISDILPEESFLERVKARIRPSLQVPHAKKSLVLFKNLVRGEKIKDLERIHTVEMKLLDERSAGRDSDAAEAVKHMQDAQQKAKTTTKAKL